jgi:phosphate-selective porin
MKRNLTRTVALALITAGALSACAVPKGPVNSGNVTQPPIAEKAPDKGAPPVSTCDKAREASLTGTHAQLVAALKALQADKTANRTAREYAQYYVTRDVGNAQQQQVDISLIQMGCTE